MNASCVHAAVLLARVTGGIRISISDQPLSCRHTGKKFTQISDNVCKFSYQIKKKNHLCVIYLTFPAGLWTVGMITVKSVLMR